MSPARSRTPMTISTMTIAMILAAGGSAQGGFVRIGLEAVVEGLELRARPGSALDGEGDQVVGEPRVLGEKGAMVVCADQVEALHALVAVAVVVPVPVENPAQRLRGRAE